MKVGILVAMEEEIKYLIQAMENYEVYEVAKQFFYDGFIEGKSVTIVQSGIGKVNASIATSLLIQRFKVDKMINTGSAGALEKGLEIGEIIVSEKLAYHDVDNRVFDYQYGQTPQMPLFFKADKTLSNQIRELASIHSWKVHNGLIVSGDSFVSKRSEIERIKEYFPSALITEMEGAAVAQTCYQYDIPFVVIRSVSDTADEEAAVDFDEFVVLAGKRSAELVLALIKKINE